MATSIRQFNRELYREHLEEASFLVAQRRAYLTDPEIDWPRLQPWEDRLEAHLDALVIGGDLALETCLEEATVGDIDKLHTALRILCRHRRSDQVLSLLAVIDPEDDAALSAVAEALSREAPPSWQGDLVRAFNHNSQLTPLLARVIGYRRLPHEESLLRRLADRPSIGTREIAWALGRIGSSAAIPELRRLLKSEDSQVLEAAAVALMRIGDDSVGDRIRLAAETQTWARRVLGLGGDFRSVRILLHATEDLGPDSDTITALGLLGDLGAVGTLLDLLSNDDFAESAAVALNTITGADLHAAIFIPDELHPDELFDDEPGQGGANSAPASNQRVYGNWERRPCRGKAEWQAWLSDNRHRFSREVRWRMGRPYTPSALFECLRCESTPYNIRVATYNEFVIRYRLDVPFEADLPVEYQRRFLEKIAGWLARHASSFEGGKWYFAGQQI